MGSGFRGLDKPNSTTWCFELKPSLLAEPHNPFSHLLRQVFVFGFLSTALFNLSESSRIEGMKTNNSFMVKKVVDICRCKGALTIHLINCVSFEMIEAFSVAMSVLIAVKRSILGSFCAILVILINRLQTFGRC